jgi:hypothetical protein
MTAEQHIGWVITAVHDDDDQRRVGYGQGMTQANETAASYANVVGRTIYMSTDIPKDAIPYDHAVKWRSFSDDGDPAYDGVVNIDWLYPLEDACIGSEDEDPAYNIDRFCMEDWGAVIVAYNKADIRRCRPDLAEYVAKHPEINPQAEWVKEAGIDAAAWICIYG